MSSASWIPSTQIRLNDESISREHAFVSFDDAESAWVIEDLQSTNGTKLNGKRIRSARLTDERFQIPESFDFDAYTAGAFGVVAEPATRVRVRFAPDRALQVADRSWHPSQKLEAQPDGSVELVLEVGGTTELRDWILSFGAAAEVLEPEPLREEVAAELERALARYR